MLRDSNHQIYFGLDSFESVQATPSAFDGGTTNARGDQSGTGNPVSLFTVTGDVLLKVYGACTVNLASAGGGTLEVGVAGNTAGVIAQTTGTDIDAGDIWAAAAPATSVYDIASLKSFIVPNGADIIETVGTADITAGQIYYTCLWRPLTHDASVVAA